MSDTTPQFPALENFLSAYFHQDWAVEYASPGAVVSYFLDHEDGAQVAKVRGDLERLAALDFDESALASRLRALGSEYDPARDGGSARAWLQDLVARFQR